MDEQFARDLDELLRSEEDAGLDLLSDGMLRWHDMFRPLLEASDGLAPGPLTRFLDTNTFYRAPQPTDGPPRLRAPLDERYVPPLSGPRVLTLPSPFALARGTGFSPREVAKGILRPQLDALDADLIVLAEPFLAREPDPVRELDALAESLDSLGGRHDLALQIVFGDAGPLLGRLAELPVAGIGIDFYATAIDALPDAFDKLLLAGVVDVRSSVLEDARELSLFAASLLERGVERIALVPNGDLQFVSEPIAREKVARLGRVKTTVKEEAAA